MNLKVKLKTVNDASLFVAKCNEYKNYDCDYICGRYIIDARSLMGVLSVGLDQECTVELHCDEESVCNRFREDMALWKVGKEE